MSYFTETFNLIFEAKGEKYTKESVQKEIERIESQKDPLTVFKGLWNLAIRLLQFVIIAPSAIISLSSMMLVITAAIVGHALVIPRNKKQKLRELKTLMVTQDAKATAMMNISKNADDVKAYKQYHEELQECINMLNEAMMKL